MKKLLLHLLALVLCLGAILALVGCSEAYIGQSDEEERVVYRVLEEGITYDLFRFLVAGHENLLTEGKPSFWEGKSAEEKETLWAELRAKALKDAVSVYATLDLAREHGIDPEGDTVSDRVKAERKAAIDNMGGFDAYKSFLQAQNMNDFVFRLYLQEAICRELLSKKLCIPGGALYPTEKEQVLAYFTSEEAACVSWIMVSAHTMDGSYDAEYSKEQITKIYEMAKKATDGEFRAMSMPYSTPGNVTEEECERGIYLGRDQMDAYDATLRDAIFSLAVGETSEIVETAEGFFLIRRLPKDEAYILSEEGYERLVPLYLQNMLAGAIADRTASLLEQAEATAFGETVTLEMISGK